MLMSKAIYKMSITTGTAKHSAELKAVKNYTSKCNSKQEHMNN